MTTHYYLPASSLGPFKLDSSVCRVYATENVLKSSDEGSDAGVTRCGFTCVDEFVRFAFALEYVSSY